MTGCSGGTAASTIQAAMPLLCSAPRGRWSPGSRSVFEERIVGIAVLPAHVEGSRVGHVDLAAGPPAPDQIRVGEEGAPNGRGIRHVVVDQGFSCGTVGLGGEP